MALNGAKVTAYERNNDFSDQYRKSSYLGE